MPTDASAPPAPADRVGTVVAGRYRITAQLGEGGIGTVYAAEDVVLRMKVAIKLLKPDLSTDPEVVARFEREADAMLALAHENIVQALNFGRTPEGEMCMVMELVEGETLRAVLRRVRPFPLHGAADVGLQVSAALVRAHSLGIVHRDLKPENVMVAWTPEGRARCKVLDFGMARILVGGLAGGTALTRKGQVFGTPEYMAPEQAMGQPVDARCDQYAFGVMLYEMLAGRRPFKAATPLDLLQLQIHEPPPPLREVAPHVPAEVAAVVERMLAKRALDRFPTVQAAGDALAVATRMAQARASLPGHEPASPGSRPSLPDASSSQRKWWQVFTGPGAKRS
jgi:serine/threonine-protein kinase